MIQELLSLTRRKKQTLMIAFDVLAFICIIYISFWIRLGYFFHPSGNIELLLLIFFSPILGVTIFIGFGLYREVIRYVSFRALWLTIQASTLYGVSWGLIIFMVGIEPISRSVILINWALVVLIFSGSRFFARWLLTGKVDKNNVVI